MTCQFQLLNMDVNLIINNNTTIKAIAFLLKIENKGPAFAQAFGENL